MPYSNLPAHAFWKLCRDDGDFLIESIYQPKFALAPGDRVATAGSCFAQNIGRYIRRSDLRLVDVEPAPASMPAEVAMRFGYGLFSARYGNVYTARQLRQLLSDCLSETLREDAFWDRDGQVFDALRPNVEPDGFADLDQARAHRLDHLRRVRSIFKRADVFVFTLGLTETWADRHSGTIYPTAPGVIAGQHDPARHHFINLGFADTLEDMAVALDLMRELAPKLRVILTVSPVPLTATASGQHVLRANTYSKSVLRAVAEELTQMHDHVDYFAAYEIITGLPFGARMYEPNLRNVRAEAVDSVMSVFFGAHPDLAPLQRGAALTSPAPDAEAEAGDDLICEEAMLEAFAPK
ncbi:GSCFA domain-containing protein [Pseudooceanicola sp.]|uniref:GSCFA domain-containing protein n=1 Tax=Pseudooceanicola sp. TaxID=1914328 RepID=UPI0026310003|nr:GSCFA domain-containing protein [Pseudooceanicola sp.]MDF1853859.1 GSCFA domain-containing protein [Pseudooceanicola sp.]